MAMVSIGNSVRTNACWAAAGNFTYAGTQWGMLVCLAKLSSADTVGRFSLGLAVTAPLFMLADMQLRTLLATDARGIYAFSDFLVVRAVAAGLACVALSVIALAMGVGAETKALFLVVGLAKASESFCEVFHGLFQGCQRLDWVAVAQMLRGVAGLALLAAGLAATGSVVVAAAGLAVASILVLVCYELPLASRCMSARQLTLAPSVEWCAIKRLLVLGAPLGAANMLVSLNANIPRYAIERSLGERALGIYAGMAYVMVAGLTVTNALAQATSARLASHYNRGDTDGYLSLVWRAVGVVLLLGVVSVVVAGCRGSWVLRLLYTAEYAAYAPVLVVLVAAMTISCAASLLESALTAARVIRGQVVATGASVMATAGSAALLIPAFGLSGAAWSVVVAAAVRLVVVLWLLGQAVRRSARARLGGRL